MNQLTLNSELSRSPDVAFTQIDDDIVMMGPKDSLFYGVNSVGTAIWSLLESKTLTLKDICKQIQQDYEVTETQCVEDITRFVESMVEQHMLVIN